MNRSSDGTTIRSSCPVSRRPLIGLLCTLSPIRVVLSYMGPSGVSPSWATKPAFNWQRVRLVSRSLRLRAPKRESTWNPSGCSMYHSWIPRRSRGSRASPLQSRSCCFCFWHCAGDCPAETLTGDGTAHLRFGQHYDINRAITKELLVRLIFDAGGLWQGDSPDGGHGSRAPRVGPPACARAFEPHRVGAIVGL